jgi:hypothetical protein
MDVHGTLPGGVAFGHQTLDFTDSEHGAFNDSFDVCAFLGVNHLVVTVFKLPIDVDILDVETRMVLKPLCITGPSVCVRPPISVEVGGDMLHLHLLLEVIHRLV